MKKILFLVILSVCCGGSFAQQQLKTENVILINVGRNALAGSLQRWRFFFHETAATFEGSKNKRKILAR